MVAAINRQPLSWPRAADHRVCCAGARADIRRLLHHNHERKGDHWLCDYWLRDHWLDNNWFADNRPTLHWANGRCPRITVLRLGECAQGNPQREKDQ
jgi:hypothetical protein